MALELGRGGEVTGGAPVSWGGGGCEGATVEEEGRSLMLEDSRMLLVLLQGSCWWLSGGLWLPTWLLDILRLLDGEGRTERAQEEPVGVHTLA